MSSRPIFDHASQREARLRDLGIVPAPEALPGYREQRFRELGIEEVGENLAAPWLPVTSSNVEAIRWVGGEYGLQVRFLAKGRRPSTDYEYAAPRDIYEDMRAAMSKGQFVWHILRADRVPYRRIR